MALMPGAIQRGEIPTTNYSTGGLPKIGGVVHVIVGNATSAIDEFQTPGEELSAHFVVAGPLDEPAIADGTIFQLLDTDDCCYAQEAGNFPPTAYIAVEGSGTTTTAMSAAQCESYAQIFAWASKVHGFPLTGIVAHGKPGITTHCNPNGTPDPNWGNHPCPGPIRLAQVPGIIARAIAINTPTPVPPPPPEETPVAVSQTVQFKPGQVDMFQVSSGILFHKWHDAAGWHTEEIAGPTGGVSTVVETFNVAPPGVSVLSGACMVTVEATNDRVFFFEQAANSATWGAAELP
jgi:hypothetical protein